MYFKCNQTRDFTYLTSKNKKWQLSKFPWLPNVLVVSQTVAAMEKTPFFCTSPLWSLGVLGMKVRRESLSEFWGWVRMTQEVWRVPVGWEERVITGWEQSRQTAEKWAGLRGRGALFIEFWGLGLRENEVKPVNFLPGVSSKIPSASFCQLDFRLLRINTCLFFLEICHYPSKGQNGPYSSELVKVNFWDCVRNAGFISWG